MGGGKKLSTKGRVLRPCSVLAPPPLPGSLRDASSSILEVGSDFSKCFPDSLRGRLSGLVLGSPAESNHRRGRSGHPGGSEDAVGGRGTLEGRLPGRGRRTGEGAPSPHLGLPPPLPAPAADPTRLLREIC